MGCEGEPTRLSANSPGAEVLEDCFRLLSDAILKNDAKDDFAIDPLRNAGQWQHQTFEDAHWTCLHLSSATHWTGTEID